MMTVTVDEVRANLPDLLRRVAAGEEVVIADAGRWVAQLAPPPDPPPTAEFAAQRARAKAAVLAMLKDQQERCPILADGTRVQDFIDRVERDE